MNLQDTKEGIEKNWRDKVEQLKQFSREPEDENSSKYKFNQLFSKSPFQPEPIVDLYDINQVEKALD